MTAPVYAVGDLHGRRDEFDRAVDLIDRDGGARAQVVWLGDYVDRGPDSRGVIQGLIDGKAAGRDWITLKGNHDRMFEWFVEDPPRHDPHMLVGYHWFHDRIGGIETMASYGVRIDNRERLRAIHDRAVEAVPASHVGFLRSLALMHQTPSHIFVHAGLRPGIPVDRQDEEDLIWIRGEFHDFAGWFGKVVVHGHTPVDRATHYGNRVNLDSGAGYGRRTSVAVFEGPEAWLLDHTGRRLLNPRPGVAD